MAAQGRGENAMGARKTCAETLEEAAVSRPAMDQKDRRARAVIGVGHGRPVSQLERRHPDRFPLGPFSVRFFLVFPAVLAETWNMSQHSGSDGAEIEERSGPRTERGKRILRRLLDAA